MSNSQNNKRLREAFAKLDTDQDKRIRLYDLHHMLDEADTDQSLKPQEIKRLLTLADTNHDGSIDFNEFVRMMYPSTDHAETKLQRMVFRAASVVTPISEQSKTRGYLAYYSCLPPPIFILLISIAEIAVFLYYAIAWDVQIGWLTGCPGCKDPNTGQLGPLIFDPKKKQQVWRFFSYMFLHQGIEHILMNVLMQLILGILLELVHKFWRIAPLYVLGVGMGALMQASLDPYVVLVGASGGGYALISAHLSNVIINWAEMPLRWVWLIGIGAMIGFDFGHAIYRRFGMGVCSNVSFLAHVGGAFTGLLLGIVMLRNLQKHLWERVLRWICLALYVLMAVAFILLLVFQEPNSEPLFTTRCIANGTNR